MIHKKWNHCPCCGGKNSMKRVGPKTELLRGYETQYLIEIEDSMSYICELCQEGFWTKKTNEKIEKAIKEYRNYEKAWKKLCQQK